MLASSLVGAGGTGIGRTGPRDEEGHVSWERELTLQGAGGGWVGVLPLSDLGVGEMGGTLKD